MSKSSNYQNAANPCTNSPDVRVAMQAIQSHGCLPLVSREKVFSIFYMQAQQQGHHTKAARLLAARWMLDLLNEMARRITEHACITTSTHQDKETS